MTVRPVLFSPTMVRALLDGRKTQTRRVLVPQPDATQDIGLVIAENPPRFAVGDSLYVREAWRVANLLDGFKPSLIPAGERVEYLADDARLFSSARLRPGMYMPRWASRLTLTVTNVRVQRLQEISEADAIAEGIDRMAPSRFGEPMYRNYGMAVDFGDRSAVYSYRTLWDSLNAKRADGVFAWKANPWVIAVTFTVAMCNIDALRAA